MHEHIVKKFTLTYLASLQQDPGSRIRKASGCPDFISVVKFEFSSPKNLYFDMDERIIKNITLTYLAGLQQDPGSRSRTASGCPDIISGVKYTKKNIVFAFLCLIYFSL